MLRPKKKISKRELKQDALVTAYAKFSALYSEKRKQISVAVTTIIIVILAVVVYVNNRTANNEKASAALGNIYPYFDSGQYAIAMDGVPEKNIPGLKSIVENYGGTPSGEIARFYLASCYYHLGTYDEALEHFERLDVKGQLLEVARYSGIACSYEAKGQYAEAAENYERAATAFANDVSAAENLNHAARNYSLVGEKEKALELYKKLKKNYPTTSFGREAERYISKLSV